MITCAPPTTTEAWCACVRFHRRRASSKPSGPRRLPTAPWVLHAHVENHCSRRYGQKNEQKKNRKSTGRMFLTRASTMATRSHRPMHRPTRDPDRAPRRPLAASVRRPTVTTPVRAAAARRRRRCIERRAPVRRTPAAPSSPLGAHTARCGSVPTARCSADSRRPCTP